MSAPRAGVELPTEGSGSEQLFAQLQALADHAGGELGDALPTDARSFRGGYGEHLVQFESRRVARADRAELAAFAARAGRERLCFVDERGERPLGEALAPGAPPLDLERHVFAGAGGLAPVLPLEPHAVGADAFASVLDRWLDETRLTEAAVGGLRWTLDAARGSGGELDLRGHAFAILGAAAELAPSLLLLEAGARVLWIDRVEPPEELDKRSELSGELSWVRGGADLLTQPAAIAATIDRFAGNDALHLGLYAYAPGAGREWRLAAAMNAIAEHVTAPVRSVSLLISPTSPAVLEPEDRAAADARRAHRPAWQAWLDRVARFPAGPVDREGLSVPRSLVSIQGAGYQAAQYLAKRLPAEAWASEGLAGRPVAVSANVAPISQTRSLEHPIFTAAFDGASAFGVETYPSPITRSLMTWLMIHDVLNPDAPGAPTSSETGAARARRAASQQAHGGLFGLPYALEPALRYAALIGFAKRPSLLGRFLRR